MHQVLNEDCLEALTQMDEGIFDLALIDPPYFDYHTGLKKDKSSKLSQSIVQQSREDQLQVVRQCIRVLKPDRAFFLFTNWENIYWMQEPLQSFLRNMIIWDETNWSAGDLKGSFGNQYEVIFLGTKGRGWTYKGKRESDIWTVPRIGASRYRLHPTEKPVALYRKIIENSTDEGDFILDPYGGSGSSVIAAISLGRNFLGYEIDEFYYKQAIERISEYEQLSKERRIDEHISTTET